MLSGILYSKIGIQFLRVLIDNETLKRKSNKLNICKFSVVVDIIPYHGQPDTD